MTWRVIRDWWCGNLMLWQPRIICQSRSDYERSRWFKLRYLNTIYIGFIMLWERCFLKSFYELCHMLIRHLQMKTHKNYPVSSVIHQRNCTRERLLLSNLHVRNDMLSAIYIVLHWYIVGTIFTITLCCGDLKIRIYMCVCVCQTSVLVWRQSWPYLVKLA